MYENFSKNDLKEFLKNRFKLKLTEIKKSEKIIKYDLSSNVITDSFTDDCSNYLNIFVEDKVESINFVVETHLTSSHDNDNNVIPAIIYSSLQMYTIQRELQKLLEDNFSCNHFFKSIADFKKSNLKYGIILIPQDNCMYPTLYFYEKVKIDNEISVKQSFKFESNFFVNDFNSINDNGCLVSLKYMRLTSILNTHFKNLYYDSSNENLLLDSLYSNLDKLKCKTQYLNDLIYSILSLDTPLETIKVSPEIDSFVKILESKYKNSN